MNYIPLIDYTAVLQSAVTKTASFDSAAYDLGSGFAPFNLGHLLAAVVEVTAIDLTSTNETYTFKLQESADGSTGWTDIGVAVSATATGNLVVKGVVTTRYIRLVLTAAGTTPSIAYSAKLAQ